MWIASSINKALVYGPLTGLLAAVYAGLILGLESLVAAVTGGGTTQEPLVVSTLAIAALFQPLRHRLQTLIDRRFYRQKYDAQMTLEAFSALLHQEVDLELRQSQLLATVQETMQPAQIALWIRPSPTRPSPTDWSHTAPEGDRSDVR
jgi:hypothetical protein